MLMTVMLILVASTAGADDPAREITVLLDTWHSASAAADADTYFGLMTPDCVFLGTDASERWRRDELRTWAEPYFAEAPAWAFNAHDRTIYTCGDGDVAWFEEYLDTNMGPCRASGVVSRTADGWRIRHYDLALTVPNDLIDALGDLVAGRADED